MKDVAKIELTQDALEGLEKDKADVQKKLDEKWGARGDDVHPDDLPKTD